MALALLGSCGNKKNYQAEADTFLKNYSQQYQQLYTRASEAEWASNTHIVEGDSTNALATRKANEAMAAFTGSAENIQKTKTFLNQAENLTDLQVKQLKGILFRAANNPQTIPEVVKKRIKAETDQTEKLDGFDFKVNGQSVSTNQIDSIQKAETHLTKRQKAWEASKEVGIVLKPGLVNYATCATKPYKPWVTTIILANRPRTTA